MALSGIEKLRILRNLGWPAKTTDPTSLSYSKIVSDRLTNLTSDIESEVRLYMDRLQKMDDRLETAISRAGVKRIDDIELNSTDEFMLLRSERKKLIRELAVILDIAIIGGSGVPGQGSVIA